MPIDTNIYMDFIKNRMTPEQAKELAEKMDRQSASRGIFALAMLVILLGFMGVCFLFR